MQRRKRPVMTGVLSILNIVIGALKIGNRIQTVINGFLS